MKTTIKTLFLSLIFIGALSSFTTAPPKADVSKDQYTIDYDGINVYNSCSNETVEMSGWIKVNVHSVTLNGVTKTQYHYNYNLKGEGLTSGKKYQYKANVNAKYATSSCSYNSTDKTRLRFSAQGSGDNDLIIVQTSTYTRNCDDGATSDYTYTTECK